MDIEVYSRRLETVSNRGSDFSRGNNGGRPPAIRWRILLATIRTFLTSLVSLAAFSRTFASSARFFVALSGVRFRKSLFARRRFRRSRNRHRMAEIMATPKESPRDLTLVER